MDRTELVIMISAGLFAAFILGWLSARLVSRISKSSLADKREIERLARELIEAEEIRDEAVARMSQREAQLTSQRVQAEAERDAAMDGLREARAEIERLRGQAEGGE